MRLTSLSIYNFKGIDEAGVHIALSPITLLFGPNNAGKSTVIQALYLAKEVLLNDNPNPDHVDGGGDFINLGGFKEFVHNHDLKRNVSIKMEIDLEGIDLPAITQSEEIHWQLFLDLVNEIGDAKHSDSYCPYSGMFDKLNTIGNEGSSWYQIQEALNRVELVGVSFTLSWGSGTNRPYVSTYTILINNIVVASIHCNENGQQLFYGVEISQLLSGAEKNKLKSQRIKQLAAENQGDDYPEIELPPVMQELRSILDLDATWDILLPNSVCAYCSPDPQIINAEIRGCALPAWDKKIEFFEDYDSGFNSKLCSAFLSSLLIGPGLLLRKFFQKQLQYVGPIREIPPRNFQPAATHQVNRWANGLAAWDVLFTTSEMKLETINTWLNGGGSLNTGYQVERKKYLTLQVADPLSLELRKVAAGEDLEEENITSLRTFLNQPPELKTVFKSTTTGLEVCPKDMGVGISQVMPIIIAAALPRLDALIAIEQPELHIHPAWQTVLGDLFINSIHQDDPPQFLLETHSEHLLLRLLRRIRHTNTETVSAELTLTNKDIAVYWVGRNESGSEITYLEIDKDGSFNTPWPEGFFDERGEELFG